MSGANALPDDLERERADLDLLRRRIVNVVGHALRTPMATLRGRAEVLAVETDDDRREEMIEDLLLAARRMEKLLDDVLVAAEIDTRLPVGRPAPTEVGGVAGSLAPSVVVDDDGIAFEPFYRGEHAVIRNAVGLGLGLTVARRIAEHVGGRVWLERRRGGGVDAVLEVPAA